MARANRHHIPGYVWHITHRCHKREFLLKFDKDKKQWRDWLFESRKRFGLCILNYTITSNHIHLLVYDRKKDVISRSIQLIAGRTAREFNRRKKRKGAFWEDRYHATAVQTGSHLVRCLVYIDLNMVRAGVVSHPRELVFSGYNELQRPKQRYAIIDHERLSRPLCMKNDGELSRSHHKWVENMLAGGSNCREREWSESIAIGDKAFVQATQSELGGRAVGRKIYGEHDDYQLRETCELYNSLLDAEKRVLKQNNSYVWHYKHVNSIK
jgi:REP element-mobilizing transposase RayT